MSNFTASAPALEALDRAITQAAAGDAVARREREAIAASQIDMVTMVARSFLQARPDAAFARRLATELAEIEPVVPSGRRRLPRHRAMYRANGIFRMGVWQTPRRALPHVLFAMLLAITASGVWLSGSGLDRGARKTQGHVQVRAVTAAATPLVSLRGMRITLEPGTYYTDVFHGSAVLVVLEGRVAFHSLLDGPEASLDPAGTGIVSVGSTVILRNDGNVSASIQVLHTTDAADMADGTPYLNPGVAVIPMGPWLPVREPSFADLRRVAIEPTSPMAPWTLPGPTMILVVSGELGMTVAGEFLPYRYEPGIERVWEKGARVSLNVGTEVRLRAVGDGPVTVLVMAVIPVGLAGGGAPGAKE